MASHTNICDASQLKQRRQTINSHWTLWALLSSNLTDLNSRLVLSELKESQHAIMTLCQWKTTNQWKFKEKHNYLWRLSLVLKVWVLWVWQLICMGCLSKVLSDPWLHVLMFQLGIDYVAPFCTVELSTALDGKRVPLNVWLKFNWLFQWRGADPFHSLFVAPKLCLTCSFVPIQAPATQAATNALILISLHSASLLA